MCMTHLLVVNYCKPQAAKMEMPLTLNAVSRHLKLAAFKEQREPHRDQTQNTTETGKSRSIKPALVEPCVTCLLWSTKGHSS